MDSARSRQTATATSTPDVIGGGFVSGFDRQRAFASAVRIRGHVWSTGSYRGWRTGQLYRDRDNGNVRRRHSGNGSRQRTRKRHLGRRVGSTHKGFGGLCGSHPAAHPDFRRTTHIRVPVARGLLLSVLVVRQRTGIYLRHFCGRFDLEDHYFLPDTRQDVVW